VEKPDLNYHNAHLMDTCAGQAAYADSRKVILLINEVIDEQVAVTSAGLRADHYTTNTTSLCLMP